MGQPARERWEDWRLAVAWFLDKFAIGPLAEYESIVEERLRLVRSWQCSGGRRLCDFFTEGRLELLGLAITS